MILEDVIGSLNDLDSLPNYLVPQAIVYLIYTGVITPGLGLDELKGRYAQLNELKVKSHLKMALCYVLSKQYPIDSIIKEDIAQRLRDIPSDVMPRNMRYNG